MKCHAALIGPALVVASQAACGRVGFALATDSDVASDARDAATNDAPANRMFITRTTLASGFGGHPAADAICNAEASAANVTGNFVAVLYNQGALPTELVDATGFVRFDGRPIGNHIEDLIAGVSLYPVDSFADGTLALTINNLTVWTGNATSDCNMWTATTGVVGYGVFYAARHHAVGIGVSTTCDNAAFHLWCSEVAYQTTVTATPVSGRVAFVTSEPFTSVAEADQHCTTTANAAGFAGSFAALLAVDGASPASRFSTAGAPWVTTDRLLLAPTADAFFDGVWFTGMTKLGPTASAIPAIGSASLRAAPSVSDNCSNWTDHTANLAQGITYYPNSEFLDFDKTDCTVYRGSICLQL